MSTLKLDLFPGLNGVSKTVSGSENLSSGILNQEVGKTQQTTGLLSGLGKAASKGSSTVSDRALKLLFSILSLYFSILRKIIPPSVWNFFIFFIPPLIGFYELAFRVYFPIFPPVFAIAFKLHQRGFLTIGTVIWLASSLPADFLGGLGALGGIATGTTVAIADGAAAAGHVLAGAVHLVGDAANTVTHGVDILKPGVVSTNLAHLLSGEHTIPSGSLIPLATTENAAKLADVLESVTPLQMNSIPKGFQDAQKHLVPGEQAISTGESLLVPGLAKEGIENVGSIASAITSATIHPTENPLTVIKDAQAAATGNVTKFAKSLERSNPLHLNVLPKEPQASQPNSTGNLLHPKISGAS